MRSGSYIVLLVDILSTHLHTRRHYLYVETMYSVSSSSTTLPPRTISMCSEVLCMLSEIIVPPSRIYGPDDGSDVHVEDVVSM